MENELASIGWEDFSKVEMRVGTVTRAEVFEEVYRPAYKLWIDFGPLGVKKTSAQITIRYPDPGALIGKQVIAVVNFPKKQIATLQSECLVLGAIDQKEVTLLTTDRQVDNGLRIG